MTTSSPSNFGERLKARIKQQGMTSKQFAHRLDVSPNSVTSWTKGQYLPGHKHAAQIATVLGVTIDELHGRPAPPVQAPPPAPRPAPVPATPAPASRPDDAEAQRIVAALAALDLEGTVDAVQRLTPPLMEILAAARRHAAGET